METKGVNNNINNNDDMSEEQKEWLLWEHYYQLKIDLGDECEDIREM